MGRQELSFGPGQLRMEPLLPSHTSFPVKCRGWPASRYFTGIAYFGNIDAEA
jgi:hypothetical protein